MIFTGHRKLGSLWHRDLLLGPTTRPWITDLSVLRPFEGLSPGDLPEFETDPDWSAWRIGDTPEDSESAIGWLEFRDGPRRMLVADRMLMSRISWADLDEAGYVSGRAVSIDGRGFCARLLTGGRSACDDPMTGAREPNEWDTLMSGEIPGTPQPEAGDHAVPLSESHRRSTHNAIWNWFAAVSWTQEPCLERGDGRICRGYHGPLFFYTNTVDHRHEDIGWRPVLEADDE
jgi:hypothetical protein